MSPQGADDDTIEAPSGLGPVPPQKAGLATPQIGKTVVVVRSERRLAVPNEIQMAHQKKSRTMAPPSATMV